MDIFFLSFFHIFDSFINIHEYANEIIFSYRTTSSINSSYDITGSILNKKKCHNDSLDLKLVHLWLFKDFFLSCFMFS